MWKKHTTGRPFACYDISTMPRKRDMEAEKRSREWVAEHYLTAPSARQLAIEHNRHFAADIEAGRLVPITKTGVIKKAARQGISRKEVVPVNGTLGKDTHEEDAAMSTSQPKTGLESRDGYDINWSTRQIITHLGEFGSIVYTFDQHKAIQRAYVDKKMGGEGQTAAEVAIRFVDFPHAKAVHLYARIHGFSKASLPQTDIEFEEGMTPEDAAEENVRTFKRNAYRKTQTRIWKETQKAADKWFHFNDTVAMTLRDWAVVDMRRYKAPVFRPRQRKTSLAAVLGLSDLHFGKFAYGHDGVPTYTKQQTSKLLGDVNQELIRKMLSYDRPEVIYIPVGTDNLHVDNANVTTTRGTPQHAQADIGIWQEDLKYYCQLMVDAVELYAQIAPVVLIPMEGNHDNEVSRFLHILFSFMYKDRKDVKVLDNHDPLVWVQYHRNALGFQHGDGMSLTRQMKDAHKHFLYYARRQGIKDGDVDHRAIFSGHWHFDQYADLGELKHFVIPSLAPPDAWHKEKGYVGTREEASIYLFERKKGRQVVLYS